MSILASLIVKKINEIFPPLPREQRIAENIISKQAYLKNKSYDVAVLSAEVKAQVTENMRNKRLKRFTIIRIREYLEQNVKAYPTHFKYKNDIHKIMTILGSGAITQEQLLYVKSMLR